MTGCSLRYLVVLIVAVGALSWLIRALPFLLFGRSGEPPKLVVYIGRVLSPAAIAMLVIYCYAGYVRDRPPAERAGERRREHAVARIARRGERHKNVARLGQAQQLLRESLVPAHVVRERGEDAALRHERDGR